LAISADNIPIFGLAAGDNGGPLFVQRTDAQNVAYRDVIGVASIIGDPADPGVRAQGLPAIPSCMPDTGPATECDAWVDVTNSAAQGWVTSAATDPTVRGPEWIASHPSLGSWLGDVDYYGPCQSSVDSDCDHIFDTNTDGSDRDNCASVYNPDQTDSRDNGVGDACFRCVQVVRCMNGSHFDRSPTVCRCVKNTP
jgi:hypothetical protein